MTIDAARDIHGAMNIDRDTTSRSDKVDDGTSFAHVPDLEPDDYPAEALFADQISPSFLRQNNIIPLRDLPGGLMVAVADPHDAVALKATALATGRTLLLRLAPANVIQELIDRVYGASKSAMQQIIDDLAMDMGAAALSGDDDIDRLTDLASEAPVVRLVNHLIAEAAQRRASDIHIEPFPDHLIVRYRIDGILIEVPPPPVGLGKAVVSRLKILARLNIAERRLPQDGRIRFTIGAQQLDLRISTLPTVHGESVVIRLLPVNATIRDFAGLGLPLPLRDTLNRLATAPHGMILVTGPTGSGKTTTLYAVLHLINQPTRKVLTVEDPVEYHMEGINQVQVLPTIDLTFARILRAMLRQDPDVIMIGEMRDAETADIAIHAALTGHLVLSTLHTNDAASAITRLLDMNIEPFLLASTVRAIIAQRLVRVLCPHCRIPIPPGEDFMAAHAASAVLQSLPDTIYAAGGCDACNNTGFSGRLGLFEVMPMSDQLRRLTVASASASEIHQLARATGMITMLEDGLAKVIAGVTTFEEVRRVTES